MSRHDGTVGVTKVPRSRKPGDRYRVAEVEVPVSGRESSEGLDTQVELEDAGMALWLCESHGGRALASELAAGP